MRWLILIILLPLLLGGAQASPSGCMVAGADVAASLAGATTCLDIPAGVYAIGPGTGGAWLNAPQDGLEIRGAGMGLTVLRITSPLTLTSDMAALRLFGVAQQVHDLTIDLGGGHSGAGSLAGISVYGSGAQGAYVGRAERATIERVEVLGGYSATGAGGYGVGTYRAASDQGGAQYVTIRDCLIHDSPATAIGVNSSYNTIAHNTIARVGTNGLSHGLYMQGGYNVVEGNTIDRASGWSIHGYKQVPSIDASGDRYIGNTSTNPGSGHIVVNGTGGAPGTRYATISGNVLRNTAGRRTQYGIWCNGVPCLIAANVLEDVVCHDRRGLDPGLGRQRDRWQSDHHVGRGAGWPDQLRGRARVRAGHDDQRQRAEPGHRRGRGGHGELTRS